MSNIAFIGDIDLIMGFTALGADVFGIEKKEGLTSTLEHLAKKDYKVVFILENWAKAAGDVVERYRDRFVSMVIIPDYRGDLGVCNARIKDAMIDAVGVDILNPAPLTIQT